jgi:hypothetical protein
LSGCWKKHLTANGLRLAVNKNLTEPISSSQFLLCLFGEAFLVAKKAGQPLAFFVV